MYMVLYHSQTQLHMINIFLIFFCLKWYTVTFNIFKKNLVLILILHEIIMYVAGNMLVGLNDIDVTWINLDNLFI